MSTINTFLGRIHIVGIGGAGMSGLARLLLAQGVQVSGSDAKESKRLTSVAAEGARVFVGHAAANILDEAGKACVDTIAYSTAVPATNPELVQAQQSGVRVLSRADLLCAITDSFEVISVAGTHGKTTTTSMLTIALQHCGVDPSFAIGSELNETGSNAHLGAGEVFVVEADESDGTFLRLNSKIGIVTNVEADHLNYWETVEKLEQGFLDFALGIKANAGVLVICVDDAGAAKLAAQAKKHGVDTWTYGQTPEADYIIELREHDVRGWSFNVMHQNKSWADFKVNVPGVHNVLNATGAALAAVASGQTPQQVAEGIALFTGTRRRFDFKGLADGVRVYDDYAHHPTEIEATLRAARDVAGAGRVIVAFQAHHYYRTALFSKEFGQALALADFVVVLEVFAPGEEFLPGSSGQTLAENVTLPADSKVFEPSWSKVSQHLVSASHPGDIIMTLGAGEIGMLCSEIVQLLVERENDRDS
ncbi:MAG: hypothetical protein RIS75_1262 [Actinomycetota bacterium]